MPLKEHAVYKHKDDLTPILSHIYYEEDEKTWFDYFKEFGIPIIATIVLVLGFYYGSVR